MGHNTLNASEHLVRYLSRVCHASPGNTPAGMQWTATVIRNGKALVLSGNSISQADICKSLLSLCWNYHCYNNRRRTATWRGQMLRLSIYPPACVRDHPSLNTGCRLVAIIGNLLDGGYCYHHRWLAWHDAPLTFVHRGHSSPPS